MTDVQPILERFERDWAAGRRPKVEDALAAVDDAQREALRVALVELLARLPVPAYTRDTLATLHAEPGVAAAASLASPSDVASASLHGLRLEAQIRRDDIVEKLIQRLSLPPDRPKIRRYLHDLETGLLDPGHVAARLVEALASIMCLPAQRVSAAIASEGAAPNRLGAAYQRAYDEPPPFSVVPPGYQPGSSEDPGEWDDIDRVFRGGP